LNKGKGESKMLTREQKEKYLRYPGNCPHCGSYELSYEKVTFEANKVWHEISCSKCNKRWADIYSLTGMEEIA
jgi:transcription elongation factor Elf1